MPTEKAKELKERFGELAIEVVKEIIEENHNVYLVIRKMYNENPFGQQILFWQAVKTELIKINQN